MSSGIVRRAHSFGTRPAPVKNHLYALGDGARIFASDWIVSEPSLRHYAAVYITANREAMTLAVDSASATYQAAALRQMTVRAVSARNAQALLFQLDPLNRHFPRFRAIGRPGVLGLDRKRFARFDEQFQAAYLGNLSVQQASALLSNVIDAVLPLLPPTKEIDVRVQEVINLLRGDHNFRLDRLAAAVDLSYDRLSHLFVDSMGLPLRAYQSWCKLHKAITLFRGDATLRLTDIAHAAGFTDSSHLCRTFIQAHGAPPSYFLNRDYVTIISPSWARQMPATSIPTTETVQPSIDAAKAAV